MSQRSSTHSPIGGILRRTIDVLLVDANAHDKNVVGLRSALVVYVV